GGLHHRSLGRTDAFHHRWAARTLSARQGRQSASARHCARRALAGAASGADPRRKRISRFHARRLDRPRRAGRHTARRGRYAQSRAINDGLQSAAMKENLVRFSAIAKPGTPQDFAAFMRSEVPKWAELVNLAGATAE